MATLHIPNDTPEATHAAIEASQPGDTLIFDAGHYVFSSTLRIKDDRLYRMEQQNIEASDDFQGDYLLEVEPSAQCFIFTNVLDTKGKCKAINFIGTHRQGFVDSNICGDIATFYPTLKS